MSYYCKAACGTLGPSGEKCNHICPTCRDKCHGKYATSLKDCIGKVEFICNCNFKNLSLTKKNTTEITIEKQHQEITEPPCKMLKLVTV